MSIKCAFLFPGQGSQAVGMGQDFFNNSDVAKQMVADATKRTGINFEDLLFRENDDLEKKEFTQPAILLVSAIAHKLFEDEKRSTAILQPIALDMTLAVIIANAFPKRTKDVPRLMNSINMAQKARLAYILGFIDKTVLADLVQIYEIRNRFGHSFDASFTAAIRFIIWQTISHISSYCLQ